MIWGHSRRVPSALRFFSDRLFVGQHYRSHNGQVFGFQSRRTLVKAVWSATIHCAHVSYRAKNRRRIFFGLPLVEFYGWSIALTRTSVSVLWLASVLTVVLFQLGVRKTNFTVCLFARLTTLPVFVSDRIIGQFLAF
jgi:hypothetical protein